MLAFFLSLIFAFFAHNQVGIALLFVPCSSIYNQTPFFCRHQAVFFTLALCYHLRLDVVIAPASFTFFRIALGICRILWCIMNSWFLFYPKPLKYDMGMLVVFTLILKSIFDSIDILQLNSTYSET